ncbi:MAG: tetratricopeptide repeat protein [Myxococcota bacterium]
MLSWIFASALMAAPISEAPSVQRLAQQAGKAFERGDYEQAAQRLQKALTLEPDNPALIYGLAQARRGMNDCAEAIALYDQFLGTGPSDRQRADALEGRAKCGATTPPPDELPPPPEETTAQTEPSPEPSRPPDEPRSSRPSPVGPALLGAGLGLGLVGGGLVAGAFGWARRAPSSPTQQGYLDRSSRVRPLATAGWSVAGAGISMAITGSILWIVQRSRARRPARSTSTRR